MAVSLYYRVQYAMTKMTNRKMVSTRVVVKAVKGVCPSSKCSTRDCRMPVCLAGMPAHTLSNRSSLSVSSSPSCCLASAACSLVVCSSSSPSGAWQETDHATSSTILDLGGCLGVDDKGHGQVGHDYNEEMGMQMFEVQVQAAGVWGEEGVDIG